MKKKIGGDDVSRMMMIIGEREREKEMVAECMTIIGDDDYDGDATND